MQHKSWRQPTYAKHWIATEDDLVAYEHIAMKHLPQGHPSVERLRERLEHNPHLIWSIWREEGSANILAGCIVLYPLTEDGAVGFTEGKLKHGRDVRLKHLADRWSSAKGVYVGTIIGDTLADRATIMRELLYLHQTHSDLPVFARASNAIGLRLLRRASMLAPSQVDAVWHSAQPV